MLSVTTSGLQICFLPCKSGVVEVQIQRGYAVHVRKLVRHNTYVAQCVVVY